MEQLSSLLEFKVKYCPFLLSYKHLIIYETFYLGMRQKFIFSKYLFNKLFHMLNSLSLGMKRNVFVK